MNTQRHRHWMKISIRIWVYKCYDCPAITKLLLCITVQPAKYLRAIINVSFMGHMRVQLHPRRLWLSGVSQSPKTHPSTVHNSRMRQLYYVSHISNQHSLREEQCLLISGLASESLATPSELFSRVNGGCLLSPLIVAPLLDAKTIFG